MKTKKK